MTDFKVGDKVRHAQCRVMRGTVVHVGEPIQDQRWGTIRRVYWKGYNAFAPENVDWTWDFALEKVSGTPPS